MKIVSKTIDFHQVDRLMCWNDSLSLRRYSASLGNLLDALPSARHNTEAVSAPHGLTPVPTCKLTSLQSKILVRSESQNKGFPLTEE
jgi:hypothetical protein